MKISRDSKPGVAILIVLLIICAVGLALRAKHVIHENNRDAYYQYCIIMQSNIDDDMKTKYAVAYMATTNMRELSDVERATIENQVRIDTAKKKLNVRIDTDKYLNK